MILAPASSCMIIPDVMMGLMPSSMSVPLHGACGARVLRRVQQNTLGRPVALP